MLRLGSVCMYLCVYARNFHYCSHVTHGGVVYKGHWIWKSEITLLLWRPCTLFPEPSSELPFRTGGWYYFLSCISHYICFLESSLYSTNLSHVNLRMRLRGSPKTVWDRREGRKSKSLCTNCKHRSERRNHNGLLSRKHRGASVYQNALPRRIWQHVEHIHICRDVRVEAGVVGCDHR